MCLPLLAAALAGPASLSAAEVEPMPEISTVGIQTDLLLTAKAKGWTYEQAAAQNAAAEAIGAIAAKVAKERPNVFVGSILSSTPGGAPTLLVKGPADAYVRKLVASSKQPLVLADGQPYSFDQLEVRKLRVHHALEAAGYRDILTTVNITGRGVIPAVVAADASLAAKGVATDAKGVLEAVPDDLRADVRLTVTDSSAFVDTWSFGGMTVLDGGSFWATTGWTVHRGSVYGVTTAGHALGSDHISHGSAVHAFYLEDRHRGAYGDIAWYTTDATELAEFYAQEGDIRQTLYLEPRSGISIGESPCLYGRASNDRDCSEEVYDVSAACTLSGVFNDRLVLMDGITSVVGDSGGGWSAGNKAYGSQKGQCNGHDAWSVADLFDEAINVVVAIYE